MNETAVLISIKPKWVNLILSGKKTVELRKTAPGMHTEVEVPFICYIYECGTGMVVGEFVCDSGEAITEFYNGKSLQPRYGEDCLTDGERRKYANGKPLFGLHISSVKEYETPLPLSAFCGLNGNPIKKPPQSWRYVQKRVEI